MTAMTDEARRQQEAEDEAFARALDAALNVRSPQGRGASGSGASTSYDAYDPRDPHGKRPPSQAEVAAERFIDDMQQRLWVARTSMGDREYAKFKRGFLKKLRTRMKDL